jgi:hypothetical protein
MVRVIVVLFWVGLIVGTYATGNVLGNWIVCLLALIFLVRARRGPKATETMPHLLATRPPVPTRMPASPLVPTAARASQPPVAPHAVRLHAERRRWR